MKYIWEEQDIKPGRWVYKKNKDGTWVPNGWTAKWTHQISWGCSIQSGWASTHSIVDGMIGPGKSKQDMADYFNKEGIEPMPLSDLIKMINYLDGNW